MNTAQLAIHAARKVRTLGAQARSSFIERDSAIEALEWAIACGEHMTMLGPPGTGKSSLLTFFAEGLGQPHFRKLLNPDTTRDELVGVIDPFKFAQGVWDRVWSGLATRRFVFLDEIGKGSSQVVNMTLDAMEERVVTTGDTDRSIVLHTLVGASNETLGKDMAAVWDRFTIRLRIPRLSSSQSIVALLTRKRGKRADADTSKIRSIPVDMTDEEFKAMRAQALFMAENPTDAVAETIAQLWAGLGTIHGDKISDRRWERLLIVAAGRALLYGRTEIAVEDLIVGKHMLWEDKDTIQQVAAFVQSKVDAEVTEIQARERMIAELETLAAGARSEEDKARVSYRVDKQTREIAARKGRADWDTFRTRLAAIKEQMVS